MKPEHTKRHCHVCGRVVAHYPLGGKVHGDRGSHPHKCPHGKQCRGGDNWASNLGGPIDATCAECSALMQHGTPERAALLTRVTK